MTQLTGLEELSLAFCKRLTNRGWFSLSSMTKLTSLDLQGCGRKERMGCWTLAALQHMPYLYKLNMASSCWCPQALLPLAHVSSITQLNLSGGGWWTAADLSAVLSMQRMRDLHLGRCRILDDSCLARMAVLSRLERLSVKECTGVSCRGVERLYSACTRLVTIASDVAWIP